jgi:hypothetical protein
MVKFMPFTMIIAYTPHKAQGSRVDREAFGKGCYNGVGSK